MEAFLSNLFVAADKAGIHQAEAFLLISDSFEAVATDGEITQYNANSTRGLGFRAIVKGRMGYASTEAFDDEAIHQLIRGVLESAELTEDMDEPFLYEGKEDIPELSLFEPALEEVRPQQKLDFVLSLEREAKAFDPRVEKVGDATIITGTQTVRIVGTNGLDRQYTENYCGAYLQPIAKEGDRVSSGMEMVFGRAFDQLHAKTIAGAAAKIAVEGLGAKPVPSGSYRTIFDNVSMTSLLEVFSSVFSAENAQKGLSLLKGKLGETIAAQCVKLVDDPLREDGLASRPFDAEGVASTRHTVIDEGIFCTFLHNLKTANKDGVPTTGNASRGGYASSVRVAPTNFYFEPGILNFQQLLQQAGDGLVITDISGLHAGANPISGDFSLLAKGYVFQEGKRTQAVEQITVAGNFFALLKNIRAFADDLRFPHGGMGSPSADVGEMSVAGAVGC